MTRPLVSLPVKDWPDVDRERWLAAQTPAGLFEPDTAASHWTSDSRAMVEWAYGRWLAFLDRIHALDPHGSPGDRATEAYLRKFVVELQGRVAPVTTSMMVGGLLRMLAVLEPERDWTSLAQAYRHLKRTAVPSRDKLSRMVAATELFDLGLRLMATWDTAPHPVFKVTRYRDGLIIALLISCPIRLRNLAGLIIGQHLVFEGQGYRLQIPASEIKNRRPYVASVPHELTGYLDQWLTNHRPALQLISAAAGAAVGSAAGHLWIDRWSRPMSSKAIQRQIWLRTRQAFGKGICPHLFRDCAVTELVDTAPDEIGIAHDLLGHADLRTTRKHYIQAQGMVAHLRFQEVIAARRRAATSRDSTGT